MLYVCPECRNTDLSKEVNPNAAPDGFAIVTCPECGFQESFRYLPLRTLEGGPGVGKSTVASQIQNQISSFLFDQDLFVEYLGDLSFDSLCEICLRMCMVIQSTGQRVCYVGGIYPFRLTDAPETRYFNGIERCALVCDDETLRNRLLERPWPWANPEIIEEYLSVNRWYREEGPEQGIHLIDTAAMEKEEVAHQVITWIDGNADMY